MISQDDWELAKTVCTEKQILALGLWRKGLGKRRIGLLMDVDPSTAQGHVAAALRKLEKAKDGLDGKLTV